MEWRYQLDDIQATAKSFWETTAGTRVFAVHGEMGAGKTTLLKVLLGLLPLDHDENDEPIRRIGLRDFQTGFTVLEKPRQL